MQPRAWCSLNFGEAIVCCSHCGRYLGGVLGQLGAFAGTGEATSGAGDEEPAESGIACELGCGERYCDTACREKAAAACHTRLCVGPHPDTHPLYHYRVASLESGAYVDFSLAAKLAVQADADSDAIWQAAAKQPVPWWQLTASAEGSEAAQQTEDARSIAVRAWELLCAGVPELAAEGRTEQDWGQLLAFVATEKATLSRASLLDVFCRRVWDEGDGSELSTRERHGLLQLARATLARQQAQDAEEEEESEEDEEAEDDEVEEEQEEQEQEEQEEQAEREEGEEEEEEDASAFSTGAAEAWPEEATARFLNRVLAEPTAFFPPFNAAAIFLRRRLPHSCAPSCREELSDPPAPKPGSRSAAFDPQDTGVCMRVVSSEVGLLGTDSVCIVDGSGTLEERAAALLAVGRQCACARCRFEGGDAAARARVTDAELAALLELSKRDSRNADALSLLEELLRRRPSDGEALLMRSRVVGWDDRWTESHALLTQAASLAPGYAPLQAAWRASLSYTGFCEPLGFKIAPRLLSERPGAVSWHAVANLERRACVFPQLLDRNYSAE